MPLSLVLFLAHQRAFQGQRSARSLLSNRELIAAIPVRYSDHGNDLGPAPHTLLHGPMYGREDTAENRFEAMREIQEYTRQGNEQGYWMRCQREAAARDPGHHGDPMSINIVIPRIMAGAESEYTSGDVYSTDVVILADRDDCERIAKVHVQKSPNFTPILFESLISTTDNKHWANQRNYLNEVRGRRPGHAVVVGLSNNAVVLWRVSSLRVA